jgi:hypothetical protein
MTPEQLRDFEKMKRDIEAMRTMTDRTFFAELQRRLAGVSIVIEDGASASGTTIAVRNSADTGSETVAEEYTGVANLYLNGTLLGKIGYY